MLRKNPDGQIVQIVQVETEHITTRAEIEAHIAEIQVEINKLAQAMTEAQADLSEYDQIVNQ